jgi:hypothetical protein
MNRYEIRIKGHVDARRARTLGCDGFGTLETGDSLLAFDAVDQPALFGLLARIRDAGLALISVELTPASTGRKRASEELPGCEPAGQAVRDPDLPITTTDKEYQK